MHVIIRFLVPLPLTTSITRAKFTIIFTFHALVGRHSNGSYVTFTTFVPELKLIYYAEKGSSILKV